MRKENNRLNVSFCKDLEIVVAMKCLILLIKRGDQVAVSKSEIIIGCYKISQIQFKN